MLSTRNVQTFNHEPKMLPPAITFYQAVMALLNDVPHKHTSKGFPKSNLVVSNGFLKAG